MRNAIKRKKFKQSVMRIGKRSHIRTNSITLIFLWESKLFGVLNTKYYLKPSSDPQEEMEQNPKAKFRPGMPTCPLLWYYNDFMGRGLWLLNLYLRRPSKWFLSSGKLGKHEPCLLSWKQLSLSLISLRTCILFNPFLLCSIIIFVMYMSLSLLMIANTSGALIRC